MHGVTQVDIPFPPQDAQGPGIHTSSTQTQDFETQIPLVIWLGMKIPMAQ